MTRMLRHFCHDEAATTSIEYAIIAGGIAIAIIAAVNGLGLSAKSNFEAVRAALN